MKLKFLGTSDSAGIPLHNCKCVICEQHREEKKINLPTSAYIEIDGDIILLDAGRDDLCTLFDGKKIQAVFLTHFHSDHCLGLLKLRYSNDKIECYHPKDKNGFSDLYKHVFSINYNENSAFEKIEVKGIKFTPIPLVHSRNCIGYLIEYKNKKVAYLTDCGGINEKSMKFLQKENIDLAFIDACFDERRTKGNHLNYLQATKILNEIGVKEAYLMHVSHTTLEYIKKYNINLKYRYIEKDEEFIF